MVSPPILLKSLLQARHWQTYRTFCREYDKAARIVDPQLVGTWPSRAQLHRWLSGDLKGMPYPDHCRVLEAMFEGYTAPELFNPPGSSGSPRPLPAQSHVPQLFETISQRLDNPQEQQAEWDSTAKQAGTTMPSQDVMPARMTAGTGKVDPVARDLGQRLLELRKVLRLSDDEVRLLAGLAGNVVELSLHLQIDIEKDGAAHVVYRHEIFNMTAKPITRLPRELWFEYTHDRISITPTNEGDRRTVIQRVHDTPTLSKFACQISPAIQPGETAVIGYACEGGQFLDHLYWRQSIQRYTRHVTVGLRHRGVGILTACSAVEEHQDGSETFASEDLLWDYEADDVVMTLTRDYLRPNQSVTLRWDVDRAPP